MYRNHLINGRFDNNGLTSWNASGATYSPADGDDHYGLAVLSTGGDYIEQQFTLSRTRFYTIHVNFKGVGAELTAGQATLTLVDNDGNAVLTQNLTGEADTWTTLSFTAGLNQAESYTLRITNVSASGDVYVDDVWIWFLPESRSSIAARIEEKLGRLADDRNLSTTSSGTKTEGDFTYAIDAALRMVGSIDPQTGAPDIRWLDQESVQDALDYTEAEMLEQLLNDYSADVDLTIGPRKESYSQIAKSLGSRLGNKGGKGTGRVIQRKLHHE